MGLRRGEGGSAVQSRVNRRSFDFALTRFAQDDTFNFLTDKEKAKHV
jgi:hypothetical protein